MKNEKMLLNFSGSSLRKFASANAAKLLMGGVATTAVISRMSVAKELEQLKRELANVDSSKPAGIDQLKTKYKNAGISLDNFNASYWSNCKKEISRITKTNGKVICFGWNSNGIGKKYGFKLLRIMLIAHGSQHNDTIATVEIKNDK